MPPRCITSCLAQDVLYNFIPFSISEPIIHLGASMLMYMYMYYTWFFFLINLSHVYLIIWAAKRTLRLERALFLLHHRNRKKLLKSCGTIKTPNSQVSLEKEQNWRHAAPFSPPSSYKWTLVLGLYSFIPLLYDDACLKPLKQPCKSSLFCYLSSNMSKQILNCYKT